MTKQNTTAALLILVSLTLGGLLHANRSLEDAELANLEELAYSELEGPKRAFTWINLNALPYLPEAATLRAEDLVAAALLRSHGESAAVVAEAPLVRCVAASVARGCR